MIRLKNGFSTPQAYGKEGVKMNFVDRIFVGELTNTIMCEECEHVSIGDSIAMKNQKKKKRSKQNQTSNTFKSVWNIANLFIKVSSLSSSQHFTHFDPIKQQWLYLSE